MTQTLTNPKFDRVTWLGEIIAILDESQDIRERIVDMQKRLDSNGMFTSSLTGVAVIQLRALETVLGDIVDNDLAETLKKISTEKSEKVVDNQPEDW